ncbi:putative protein LONGIFOLIA [Helianthus anomalus]
MTARILHSLSEDNTDLQKQIDCMSGVFQVFDRHQIVSGSRVSDCSPKRLHSGSPYFDYETPERDSSNSYERPSVIVHDKNRTSTESSRDSFSSMSRSSSFSSLDCNINKTTHQEPEQTMFPKTPSRDSLTRQSCQGVDFRGVVKDSIYRHNPTVKENGPDRLVDYRESLDALAKSQESSWYYNEPRQLSTSKSYQLRDGSSLSVPKACPRFSYVGWETKRLSPKSDDASYADRGPLQSRPPSVVAKLMGLDAFPDSSSANQKESGVENANTVGPIKMHTCSRISQWKQRDGARSPQRPVTRAMRSPTIIHSPFSSVYSEVDKRIKDLEFTETGKDLRALKQILEAMQLTEIRKEGTQTMLKRQPVSTQNENRRELNNVRAYESPIAIIKPVNDFSIGDRKIFRSNSPKSTVRENTVNDTAIKSGGRQTRTTPGLAKQQLKKESATTSGKSSGSIGPRLSQKRRSRLPTPPKDSGKLGKQSAKQVSESSSPAGRRSKYSNIRQNDGQHRDLKGESKKLSYRETKVSHEVVNIPEFSEETDNMQSPISMPEESTLLVRDQELLGPEYPSPVSVLDDGIYSEESPSPVKHKLKTLKVVFIDDANQGIKDEWQAPDDIPNTLSSGITSKVNRKKLQDIELLVQKLTRLGSGHNEAQTDYIVSLCENTKADDMYISEILLASGLLLRDLGSNVTTFQFHSSGHPINPELFLVLEQTKFSYLTKQEPNAPKKIIKKERNHRKLIFDAVNEILAGKLNSNLPVPFQTSFKLVKTTFNTQKLLRELCLEIEQLQVQNKKDDISLEEENDGMKSVLWEEVLNRGESWTDYDGEIPIITLDVERLIFKDLVNEVVLGEAADGRRIKAGRRCRQLFSK